MRPPSSRQCGGAIALLRPATTLGRPPVLALSAVTGEGVVNVWREVERFRETMSASGDLEAKRRRQAVDWMWALIDTGLRERFRRHPGVRGDLGAVVRAILTDYEARSPAVYDDPGYGKLKEPLLRFTALLRGFSATSASGRNTSDVYGASNQAALESPTVFTFFDPG
mgnify:CR=1 FL=1